MEMVDETFGQLDILVNNAGGQFVAPVREVSNKGFEAVIRNNLIGSWQMTKAVADRFMFERGGAIVFVTASIRAGLAGFVHTAAARGGRHGLDEDLGLRMGPVGIRLNCVAPGTIKTEALGRYPIPLEDWHRFNRNVLIKIGHPQDVPGRYLPRLGLGEFVPGEDWYVDGGETLHVAHDAREMINYVQVQGP